MAAALPGSRCRPHVKAHKCTSLAAEQLAVGHRSFTCATPLEVVGMAKAGLGEDLLLANECVDQSRLRDMACARRRARHGRRRQRSDHRRGRERRHPRGPDRRERRAAPVRVRSRRCGSPRRPRSVAKGLAVRGVMGYEGHVMPVVDRADRAAASRGVHDQAGGSARRSSAATSPRAAAPAPTTCTDGRTRSRPVPTR